MAKAKSAKPPRKKTARVTAVATESILNSLRSHVAVLAPDGEILATNDAWKKFAIERRSSRSDKGVMFTLKIEAFAHGGNVRPVLTCEGEHLACVGLG
jgi:hypothetical protein